MLKKCLRFFIVFLLLFSFFPLNSSTSSDLSLTFESGFNGNVKMFKGFPLRVTAENKGDTAFSGDLVIRFNADFSSVGAKVIPIHVEPGQTSTFTVYMPGLSDNMHYPWGTSNTQEQIKLFEGDWQKGKQVTYSGRKQLNLSFISPDSKTVGFLTENIDRFAKFRSNINRSYTFIPLKGDVIPDDVLGLEMLDIIVLDEYPLATLSQGKQDALIQWLHNGGVLIVGATTNLSQNYGDLYEHLPLKGVTESTFDSVTLKENKHEVNFNNIPLLTGDAEPKTVKNMFNDIPLLFEKEFGSGTIIQTAFSIGDQPITETSGFPEWFSSYVNSIKINTQIHYDLYNSLYWEFGELNEIFGDSMISTTQLLIILLVYVIILVPVLFFILKRIDKREHAWWIIPTISLVTSILIFGYGAKDRILNPMTNTIGVFTASNDHLQGYYTVSMQSNTSGDYELQAKKAEYTPVPISRMYYGDTPNERLTYFEEERDRTNVLFPKVEYWSVRSVTGKANRQVDGMFDYDLQIQDQKLVGTITNRYPFDFANVVILSGQKEFKVGEIKEGETVNIDLAVQSNWLGGPTSSGYYHYPQRSLDDLDEALTTALKNSFFNRNYYYYSEPLLAGYTSDPIIDIEMKNKNVVERSISLVLQPFTPKVQYAGEFQLSNDQFALELDVVATHQYHGYIPEINPFYRNEIYLDPGTYQFIYEIPKGIQDLDKTFTELKFRVSSANTDSFVILNHQTSEFEPLSELGTSPTFTENIEQYISEDQKIIIQIEKTDMRNPMIYIPSISMKGSVK